MRIAALVLAAGRSRRFGQANKLLAELDGIPVVAHTLQAVTTAGFDPIIVVTGPDHAAMQLAIAGFPVTTIRCAPYHDGMGDSIAAGISALPKDLDGVAILPGDMPLLTAATLRHLLLTFTANAGYVIVHTATRDRAQRNPVIWPRMYVKELASLTGDRGAKNLIVDATAVAVADENELLDIDDPAALEHARSILRKRQAQS